MFLASKPFSDVSLNILIFCLSPLSWTYHTVRTYTKTHFVSLCTANGTEMAAMPVQKKGKDLFQLTGEGPFARYTLTPSCARAFFFFLFFFNYIFFFEEIFLKSIINKSKYIQIFTNISMFVIVGA